MKNRAILFNKLFTVVGIGFLILIVVLTFLIKPSINREKLLLTNINPEPPVMKSPWSTEPIIFSFNMPINESTISYTIDPEVSAKIVRGQQVNQFSLVPIDGWSENTKYTIVLKKSLESRTGNTLDDDIVYTFTREADFSDYPVESGEESHSF